MFEIGALIWACSDSEDFDVIIGTGSTRDDAINDASGEDAGVGFYVSQFRVTSDSFEGGEGWEGDRVGEAEWVIDPNFADELSARGFRVVPIAAPAVS